MTVVEKYVETDGCALHGHDHDHHQPSATATSTNQRSLMTTKSSSSSIKTEQTLLTKNVVAAPAKAKEATPPPPPQAQKKEKEEEEEKEDKEMPPSSPSVKGKRPKLFIPLQQTSSPEAGRRRRLRYQPSVAPVTNGNRVDRNSRRWMRMRRRVEEERLHSRPRHAGRLFFRSSLL